MADSIYELARQGFAAAGINWTADTIKATLIDTANYTVNLATHQYMNTNTVAANAKVGSPITLASKTNTLGVLDAADGVFSAVTGASVEAIIIWKDGGGGGTSASGTTDLLILYIDGKQKVKAAATAASSATTVVVDAIQNGIANAAVMTLLTGSGPATITLNAVAAAAARSLTTTALSSGLTVEAEYEVAYSGSNLPVTPNGGDINATWSNGTLKILKI